MELLRRLRNIINENYTWIRAVSDNEWRVMYLNYDGSMKPVSCRNLVLESVEKSNGFPLGMRWYIPDFELANAAAEVLAGKENDFISRRECEDIILLASGYVIQLRLKDFIITDTV